MDFSIKKLRDNGQIFFNDQAVVDLDAFSIAAELKAQQLSLGFGTLFYGNWEERDFSHRKLTGGFQELLFRAPLLLAGDPLAFPVEAMRQSIDFVAPGVQKVSRDEVGGIDRSAFQGHNVTSELIHSRLNPRTDVLGHFCVLRKENLAFPEP